MTIIAFKKNMVAWDSQITSGAMKSGLQTKKVAPIKTIPGLYCGGYGNMGEIQRWQRFLNKLDKDTLSEWLMDPAYKYAAHNTLLWVWNGYTSYMVEFYRGGQAPAAFTLPRDGYALGTGDDYAMGAMVMGASADKAVQLVCKRFDGCSGPINKVVVTKPNSKERKDVRATAQKD